MCLAKQKNVSQKPQIHLEIKYKTLKQDVQSSKPLLLLGA